MADGAIADISRRALQTNGLFVIAGGRGGIDRVRRTMTGGTIDPAAAVRFAIAIERGFVSRQVGVWIINMFGAGLAQVLPVATFAGGQVYPGNAVRVAHFRHTAMTIGTGDALLGHRVSKAVCLRTGMTGLAGIGREVGRVQFVSVEGVHGRR